MRHRLLATLLCHLTVIATIQAAEYSPHAGSEATRRVFWGDTHLHSSLSTDAFGFGVTLG